MHKGGVGIDCSECAYGHCLQAQLTFPGTSFVFQTVLGTHVLLFRFRLRGFVLNDNVRRHNHGGQASALLCDNKWDFRMSVHISLADSFYEGCNLPLGAHTHKALNWRGCSR